MRPRDRRPRGDDRGISTVEVLVAMVLVGLMTGLAGTVLVSTGRSVQQGRAQVDVTEEARLALNRMSRELREARRITAVHPALSGTTGFTFEVDFDGDGTITPGGSDPELLTYCYTGGQILLNPGVSSCTTSGLPIITAQVTSFALDYSSSYQANGVGPRTWQQLDAAGNDNGLDAGELPRLDVVSVALTVTGSSGGSESFRSTVELRNHA